MIYYVYEADGTVFAVCSRLKDAEAMCQRIGKESKKYIKKVDNTPSDVNITV